MPSSCSKCGKTDATQICSRCKCTYYCNVDCQRNDWNIHKQICKPLRKKSNDVKEDRDERNVYKTLTQNVHHSPIKFGNNNKIFILHPARAKLSKIEKEFGFSGIFSSIYSAILNCKSGDRIFAHNGVYKIGKLVTQQDISIIGVGDKVCIVDGLDTRLCFWYQSEFTKLHLENINFRISNTKLMDTIQVAPNSKLWLNRCKFTFAGPMLIARSNSYLNVNNCEFNGATS
eukprot:UN07761